MNELTNTATATGTYNNIPTSLTSNTSVVNMIDGLILTKSADKNNWADGNLTYTITIENNTDKSYVGPVIKDVIETTLVDFVVGSVTIGGVVATTGQYNYDDATGTLTITLEDLLPSSSSNITFQVKKKA